MEKNTPPFFFFLGGGGQEFENERLKMEKHNDGICYGFFFGDFGFPMAELDYRILHLSSINKQLINIDTHTHTHII